MGQRTTSKSLRVLDPSVQTLLVVEQVRSNLQPIAVTSTRNVRSEAFEVVGFTTLSLSITNTTHVSLDSHAKKGAFLEITILQRGLLCMPALQVIHDVNSWTTFAQDRSRLPHGRRLLADFPPQVKAL